MDEVSDARRQPRDWARDALLAMSRRAIPPTPENYLVWYTVVSDANATLSRVIQVLDAQRVTYDEERCRELHERFFGDVAERRALETLGGRIDQRLAEIGSLVDGIQVGTRSYDAKLQGVDAQLHDELSASDVAALLMRLRSETRAICDEASRWGSHTLSHAEEISRLRRDLASARHEAETDALTGLGNRKRFDRRLRDCARTATSAAVPLSLLICDIDHFKTFNDTYGHALGDRVLGLVASKLQGVAGDGVEVFRYGGEEFAVLVLGAELAEAIEVAETVRRSVAGARISRRSDGAALSRITISIGLSQYEPGEPVGALLERSDTALYAAKNAGRNRTSIKRPKAVQRVA